VSCRNQARIAVVDLTGDSVIYRYNYPNTTYEPEGIDIHPALNLFYCTTHGQNTIDLLDLDSMKVINSFPITYSGAPPQPSGGLFSPDGSIFLLSAQTSGKIYVYNTANPYIPIFIPPVLPSGGAQPHRGVFLNDTIAYIPNTNNTQPVGSVSIVNTGVTHANIGQVSGTWNGPLSMVLVKSSVTSAHEKSTSTPEQFILHQNYPNPFNPTTTIRFSLPQRQYVTLKVFDVLGREVATLVNAQITAGVHSIVFDSNGLASAVYFYRLETGHFVETRKLILLR